MNKTYYFFFIEIALKNPIDNFIYAFENVSHIPTEKLVEIFNIDLNVDPHILEGYFLNEDLYEKNKDYFKKQIRVHLNFNVFEYCLRLYSTTNENEVRGLYKESLME